MSTPSDDTPSRIGDRYRLEERIGAGAMGAVWRATDELLNRTVAVKELLAAAVPARGGALEESRQRILREGRIGARLQHPHVISMFDVVVHEDSPWLVMEYLPSVSLAQRLAQDGPMAPREAADIGSQVADGLAAAHKAGVVHRDIKPGNVLLGDDGRVKLTDFGVSRAVDDVQLTRTGLIAGTPAFLAPEVARGQDPTSASDVFALGATLYAAVEGGPPFGLDDNAYALLHKVATGEVEPPKQAGELHDVMMRLLAKEPEERPTAAQARDLLAKVASGAAAPPGTATAVLPPPAGRAAPRRPSPRPVPAAAPARPTRPPAEPRDRRRPPVWLIALVAALVVGGAIAAVLLNNLAGGGGGADPSAAPTTTGEVAAPPAGAPSTTEGGEDPPSPTPAPTTEPAPTTTAEPTSTPATAPNDAVQFVLDYYSQLPGNIDAALSRLSPRAVAQSGGESGYRNFWSRVDRVIVRNVQRPDPTTGTVTGLVTFTYNDGSPTETDVPYSWDIAIDDGRTIMESFSS
ncbi:serine/threonine-protein kinase [Pseudonocardia humida]|uniref:non-specific serine/threonine protein kinase n=1 Tax=Pseudonocardia humida TaxID=2800819 RepID=A0ABT1A5Q6_9PSEU|nr:serine/threonine-protein kinase [Pseudonocardia humida]MCO1658310.1 serine/threonine protein kinase [Pseudonocardia humida]